MTASSDGDRDEEFHSVHSTDRSYPGPAQDEKSEDGNGGNDGGARPMAPRRRGMWDNSSSSRYLHLSVVGELDTYSPDSYSFMSIHSPIDEPGFFGFGLGVFLFQMLILICILLSLVHRPFVVGEADNSSDTVLAHVFPSNVDILTRLTQFLAVVIYCLFADSSLRDVTKAVEQFPRLDRVKEGDKYWPAVSSCVLRFTQGLLATLVTLLLIANTADVVEIVLNFAAVGFISNLDETAFELAKWGKYGRRLEEEARRIETRKIPYCIYRKYRHKRHLYVVIPIALLLLTVLSVIATYQDSTDHWLTNKLRVQFRAPALHPYSGCYTLDPNTNHVKRKNYNGNGKNKEPAVFGYCRKDQHWVLFKNESEGGNDNDPCQVSPENELVISADTDTFDIWSSFDEPWFTASGEPLDLYFFDEEDPFNCESFMYDGVCDTPFNNETHQFDGGDCCAATCQKTNCGFGGVTSAFEKEGRKGNGYPHCEHQGMFFPVTIQLTGFRSSREKGVLDVSDAQVEDYQREKELNFWEEDPNPAYLTIDCDEGNGLSTLTGSSGTDEDNAKTVNVLSVYVDNSMMNGQETIMVPDGARCQISVTNTTNFVNEWDDPPIWFVNYTVYHGNNGTNDMSVIALGESGKEQSVAFHRIPDCYFDRCEGMIEINTAYAVNNQGDNISLVKALEWLINDNSGYSRCDAEFLRERTALSIMNFAAPIAGTADTLWISPQQQCGWKNIACDNGSVKTLVVSGLGLSGTIAPAVGFLPELQRMDYDKNTLFGTIPSEVGMLTNLRFLDIDNNLLTGSIPSELGNLVNLVELDLDENKLNGTIPTEFGRMTNARELDLKCNQLSGPIPTEIGKLLNMVTLWLTNNAMTGSMPSQLGKLTKLEELQLDNNTFTGSIPTEIGLMKSLSLINLRGNSLTGAIPSEIGLMTNLTEIRLEGNDFTGTIPVEVASLERLRILTFDDSLTGDIPVNIKTLVPCVLCSGNNYEIKNSSHNHALFNDGPSGVSCHILLDEQQDREKPISVDDCELIKETCVACSVG